MHVSLWFLMSSLKIKFSLVMSSPGGPGMVNGLKHYPIAMQNHDSYVVNFWHENKNCANWCAQQS